MLLRSFASCTSVALVAALGLTACEPAAVDTTIEQIQLDPLCEWDSLRMYPQHAYAGTPWCLKGQGTMQVPRGFDINSYQTGQTTGYFQGQPVQYAFDEVDNVGFTTSGLATAGSVTITGGFDF